MPRGLAAHVFGNEEVPRPVRGYRVGDATPAFGPPGGCFVKIGEWIREHRHSRPLQAAAVAAVLVVVVAVLGLEWWSAQGVARARLDDPKYPLEPLLGTIEALRMP